MPAPVAKKTLQERLKEIRSKGMMHRAAEVVAVDREARTVELAFSSETPVERWYGQEILSHDPKHVRMGRLQDGAALLWNHDWDDQRGVVESATIDSDRKGRALVRLSKNDDGEELLVDLEDGIKRHVSVGYMVHGLKLIEERDGEDVYLIDDWEPYEISIVSVPADTAVGVGRNAEIPQEEAPAATPDTAHNRTTDPANRTNTTMIKTLRNAAGDLVRAEVDSDGNIVREIEVIERAADAQRAQAQAGAEGERSRVRAINDLAAKFGRSVENVDDMVRTAINEGHSPEQFQGALLDGLNKRIAKPLNDQAAGADIGMDERDVANFSFLRVIRALSDPTDRGAQRAAKFEFEASEAARAKSGKQGDRFMIPTDVLRRALVPADGQRAFNTGTGGGAAGDTGGYSIATTLLTSSFIDLLRNKAVIMRLGRVLGGLQGNIDIPKQASGASGYWLGEDEDATETGIELGQVTLSPKTVAGFSEITRRLMMQSSMDVEAMVRADLAIALALTIDKAGFYGTGTQYQPLGIANYTGINAQDFTTAAKPSFAEVVEMETKIALDNADVDSMVYVGNAGFRGHAKTTLKFAAAGSATLWEPGSTVNGYRAEITNQVNDGDLFFGNFADLLIGMWGGLELTVDPYSNSKKGRIRLVAFQDVDFQLRRVESFCLGRKTS